MATFTLLVDPSLYNGTSTWPTKVYVDTDGVQVVGPAAQYVTQEQRAYDVDGDGNVEITLVCAGDGWRPATWTYRVKIGSRTEYVSAEQAPDSTVRLADLAPTSPGVPPPGWEERLRAVEDAGPGGGSYDDTELRALIAAETEDREDGDAALAAMLTGYEAQDVAGALTLPAVGLYALDLTGNSTLSLTGNDGASVVLDVALGGHTLTVEGTAVTVDGPVQCLRSRGGWLVYPLNVPTDNGGGETPDPDPVEVTPAAPTYDDTANTYTIPTSTGVVYAVDGATKTAGTYSVGNVAATLTVTATAASGYVIADAADTSWTLEFTVTDQGGGGDPDWTVVFDDDLSGADGAIGNRTASVGTWNAPSGWSLASGAITTTGSPGPALLNIGEHASGVRITVDYDTLADARYRYGGVRAGDVREQLGMTLGQWAQLVRSLLERPDVEAEAPAVVHRLRRLAEQRRAVRR